MVRRAASLLALLTIVLVGAACGDDIQYADPPKGSAGAGLPAGHPEVSPHLPPGHPPTSTKPADPADPFADPSAVGAAPKAKPEGAVGGDTTILAGKLSVEPGVTLPPRYTVYVMAVYTPTERAGVLIRRYENVSFPLEFELKGGDAVFGAPDLTRSFYVRGMISETGDASKSRLRTTTEQAYPAYTKDIHLTLKP